ncbi:hypothetical protein [Leptobacterium sp. I13]|uniref:hypothetical protein n=1 Tax=Leptobacterium meishanense TaxID=3128904 RepID=UPI0030ED9A50
MRIIKAIFDFYIHASIHVAIAVYALVQLTYINLGFFEDATVGYLAFFGTIVVYNFIKYGSKAKNYFFVEKSNEKIIQVFSILCGCIGMFYALGLSLNAMFLLMCLGIICMLYAVPIYMFKKRFREFNGIKLLIVAFVWTGMTVFLPVLNTKVQLDGNIIIEAAQRFLFIIVITLPFEIRDLHFDELSLGTIPQKIGTGNTKKLGLFFLILFVLLELFKVGYTTLGWYIMIILAIITTLLLFFSTANQSKYYSGFWVESLPILWWGMVFLTTLV